MSANLEFYKDLQQIHTMTLVRFYKNGSSKCSRETKLRQDVVRTVLFWMFANCTSGVIQRSKFIGYQPGNS